MEKLWALFNVPVPAWLFFVMLVVVWKNFKILGTRLIAVEDEAAKARANGQQIYRDLLRLGVFKD